MNTSIYIYIPTDNEDNPFVIVSKIGALLESRAICLLCWKTAGYMSLSPQIYPGAYSETLVVITLTLAPVLFYSVWIFEMTPQTTEYTHISYMAFI